MKDRSSNTKPVVEKFTIEVFRLPAYLQDMHHKMLDLKMEYETAKQSFKSAVYQRLWSEPPKPRYPKTNGGTPSIAEAKLLEEEYDRFEEETNGSLHRSLHSLDEVDQQQNADPFDGPVFDYHRNR